MPTALTPLANLTLSSAASSVTFSSISGSYRDLFLVVNTTSSVYTGSQIQIKINSDTGSNYNRVSLSNQSGGNTVISQLSTNSAGGYMSVEGGVNGSHQATFFDYAQTDKFKTWTSRAGAADYGGVELISGRWGSTSAITSINIFDPNGWNYTIGSSFALYGVSA
jgi:hypothetical protein